MTGSLRLNKILETIPHFEKTEWHNYTIHSKKMNLTISMDYSEHNMYFYKCDKYGETLSGGLLFENVFEFLSEENSLEIIMNLDLFK